MARTVTKGVSAFFWAVPEQGYGVDLCSMSVAVLLFLSSVRLFRGAYNKSHMCHLSLEHARVLVSASISWL